MFIWYMMNYDDSNILKIQNSFCELVAEGGLGRSQSATHTHSWLLFWLLAFVMQSYTDLHSSQPIIFSELRSV